LLLLPFGLFGCLVLWKKQTTPHFLWIALFVFGMYAGIFAVHSLFWACGMKGAAGLTRLLTMALPPVIALILAGCHAVTRELNTIPHILGGALLLLLAGKEIRELSYPLKADPLQRALIDATDYVHTHYPGRRIYYFHPIVAWHSNVGMKDLNPRFDQRYFSGLPEMITGMQPGILIRDPQFGPKEQGLPFSLLDSFPEKIVRVKTFRAEEPYSVYTGEKPEILVYEVR
jgi:hypothetical protein